jgi:hypothetical protein
MERVESDLDPKFGAPRGQPPPMSIKAHVDSPLLNKHLIIYWRIWDLWGLTNLVASCVTKFDDTLPRLWMIRGDSVRATHGFPAEVFASKTALG